MEWDILAVPAFRNEEYYTSTAEQEEGEFQMLTHCSFSVIALIFEPHLKQFQEDFWGTITFVIQILM